MTHDRAVAASEYWHKHDHHIIMAQRTQHVSDIRCELCDFPLVALPESVEKCKAADWHLVCHPCVGLYLTVRRLRLVILRHHCCNGGRPMSG